MVSPALPLLPFDTDCGAELPQPPLAVSAASDAARSPDEVQSVFSVVTLVSVS